MKVGRNSTLGTKLARDLWRWLDKPKIYPEDWARRMGGFFMAEEQEFGFEDFQEFIKWVATENPWTAENLRTARDPLGSFIKQYDTCNLVYKSQKAAKKARERRAWKHGACKSCDQRPAPHPDRDCKECELLLGRAHNAASDALHFGLVMQDGETPTRWWLQDLPEITGVPVHGKYHPVQSGMMDALQRNLGWLEKVEALVESKGRLAKYKFRKPTTEELDRFNKEYTKDWKDGAATVRRMLKDGTWTVKGMYAAVAWVCTKWNKDISLGDFSDLAEEATEIYAELNPASK